MAVCGWGSCFCTMVDWISGPASPSHPHLALHPCSCCDPMVAALFSPFTLALIDVLNLIMLSCKELASCLLLYQPGFRKEATEHAHLCQTPIQSLKAGQLSHGMTVHARCHVPVWFWGCCTADEDSTQQALHELSLMPLCCCTQTTEG